MAKDLIGQQLGNYQLVSLLERGGFAEVYLGQHVRLSMQAAIKVLHTHLSPGEINGFQHEADTIAAGVELPIAQPNPQPSTRRPPMQNLSPSSSSAPRHEVKSATQNTIRAVIAGIAAGSVGGVAIAKVITSGTVTVFGVSLAVGLVLGAATDYLLDRRRGKYQ